MLSPDFIQILACPLCKGGLQQSSDGSGLTCTPCLRQYLVVDGIPVLLADQSQHVHQVHCEVQ